MWLSGIFIMATAFVTVSAQTCTPASAICDKQVSLFPLLQLTRVLIPELLQGQTHSNDAWTIINGDVWDVTGFAVTYSGGTDAFKAICLGAHGVCPGRPFFYALMYGEDGVRHLVNILRDELENAMQLCGTQRLSEAHPGLLNTKALVNMIDTD
ncbi:Aldolase-type TIM barrel [Fusarium napiforme]|uniref:Aldolase-type TIM barrel n=1 Tax=Fusarium napiforme TaxID=42672 RepID=A0A8H5JNZ7_9HYPO|nr:Aldolase-type TIM barrel [Fusarium napiforme]